MYERPANGVNSILSANPHDHARMRKVLNQVFSDRAFREHEPVVEGYANLLIKRLYEQIQEGGGEAKLNMLDWYVWTSFDIMGDLAFGEKFECLQSQKLHPWVRSLCSFLHYRALQRVYHRFVLSRRVLPLLLPKRLKKIAADNWGKTVDTVTRRMELGTRRPDFMSEILKFNNDKIGLSLDEIRSNSSLFILAGSDSTSSVLTCTTFHLVQNPAIMKKLTDEVCGTFKSEAELDGQSVSKLPYLVACLDETFRIFPNSLTGQAVVVPSGGDTIGNYWVPGGVSFLSSYQSPCSLIVCFLNRTMPPFNQFL